MSAPQRADAPSITAPPVSIAVAPNGARMTRADHRGVPITPRELAQCAEACVAAGAALLHLHVRDAMGRHSLAPCDYRPALEAIRARVGDALIVQVTTEAAGRYTTAMQLEAARELAPEALSLAVREWWGDRALYHDVAQFLTELHARGALVQYIVYDRDDLALCARLHAEGTIPQRRPHVLIVLGSYTDQRDGHPLDLVPLRNALPAGWRWSVCAFGAEELRCVMAAALLGGHARVGFENNTWLPTGPAADNAALVLACRRALADVGLRCASALETRQLFDVG